MDHHAAPPAIEIRGLTKRFGAKVALDDIDLTVPAGSIFGFLGPNGAGKSTTLTILNGLAKPTSGEVRVLGHDALRATNAVRAEIGYLPDVPAFYPWMTAQEFLQFAGALFNLRGPVLQERIAALLDLAGLTGVEDRIGGYSRGMRQRLGIAQALINAPKLLLLDEPTSALDPLGRKAVLDMIAMLAGRTTIFFSTHVLPDVERVATMIAILDRGKVIAQGGAAELRAHHGRQRVSITLETPTAGRLMRDSVSLLPWCRQATLEHATLSLTVNDLPAAQREIPALLAELHLGLVRLDASEAGLEEVFIDLIGAAR